MKYIKLSTKEYPIYEATLRDFYYPASLPSQFTDEFLSSIGYAKVIEATQDIPKKPWEYVEEKEPVLLNGQYVQNWQVVNLSLTEKKARMLGYFNQLFNSLISQVKITYPPTEVESWDKQEKEAREFLLNNNAPAIIVRAIASARGIPVEVLAQRIVDKADQYGEVVGNLIGTRQMLEDQIETATEENIDSITWP